MVVESSLAHGESLGTSDSVLRVHPKEVRDEVKFSDEHVGSGRQAVW